MRMPGMSLFIAKRTSIGAARLAQRDGVDSGVPRPPWGQIYRLGLIEPATTEAARERARRPQKRNGRESEEGRQKIPACLLTPASRPPLPSRFRSRYLEVPLGRTHQRAGAICCVRAGLADIVRRGGPAIARVRARCAPGRRGKTLGTGAFGRVKFVTHKAAAALASVRARRRIRFTGPAPGAGSGNFRTSSIWGIVQSEGRRARMISLQHGRHRPPNSTKSGTADRLGILKRGFLATIGACVAENVGGGRTRPSPRPSCRPSPARVDPLNRNCWSMAGPGPENRPEFDQIWVEFD